MMYEKIRTISAQYRNVVLFIGLAMMWGSGFVAIKVGLVYYPPALYAALRNGFAAVCIFGYAAVVADRIRPYGWKEWIVTGMSGVFIIGGSQGLLFLGQQTTTSGVAAVITGMVPILTAGFARVIPPQKYLDRRELVGLIVALAGIALVAGFPLESGSKGSSGKLLIFLGASSFALGSVATQRLTVSLPVETYQAWALGIGAVLIHGISLWLGESATSIQWTPEAIVALLYLIMVPSVLGFLFYFKILDRFSSTEANLVTNVSPIFAALIGWILLSESLGLATLGGFGVIGIGWVLVSTS
jgi:probable blue pigment (indigoidine) exporter